MKSTCWLNLDWFHLVGRNMSMWAYYSDFETSWLTYANQTEKIASKIISQNGDKSDGEPIETNFSFDINNNCDSLGQSSLGKIEPRESWNFIVAYTPTKLQKAIRPSQGCPILSLHCEDVVKIFLICPPAGHGPTLASDTTRLVVQNIYNC